MSRLHRNSLRNFRDHYINQDKETSSQFILMFVLNISYRFVVVKFIVFFLFTNPHHPVHTQLLSASKKQFRPNIWPDYGMRVDAGRLRVRRSFGRCLSWQSRLHGRDSSSSLSDRSLIQFQVNKEEFNLVYSWFKLEQVTGIKWSRHKMGNGFQFPNNDIRTFCTEIDCELALLFMIPHKQCASSL